MAKDLDRFRKKFDGPDDFLLFKVETELLYLNLLATASVILLPILALTVKGGANTCLYLLVLVGLISIAFRRKWMGQTFFQILKEYWYVHLSMAAITLAMFAHQLGTGRFNLSAYDISSRLTFFALIAWALLLLPSRYLKQAQWGVVAGAVAVTIKALMLTGSQSSMPTTANFLNRIPYGDMSLLLGTLCFLSIGWSERKDKWAIALKIAAGGAALYTTYLCQTRGAWLAIPVFAAIGTFLLGGLRIKHKLAFFGLVLVMLGLVYSSSSLVQARIEEAAVDISQYRSGQNVDTSVGIRFQHWYGSWVLFKENPFFGVGRENFYPEALLELHARHIISKMATDFVHPHNQLLYDMATFGIFGLIAFWALHLGPAYFFYRAARDPDLELRTAGNLGLALVLGFFIFGLTEAIFFTPVANAYFSVIAAIFFASVVKRKQVLATMTTTAQSARHGQGPVAAKQPFQA